MTELQYKMDSPLGDLYLISKEKGLNGIYWQKQGTPLVKVLRRSNAIERILDDARVQLEEYFSGTRKAFSLPLNVMGTPFQMSVWQQLLRIPFGQTCSYRDVAHGINNPKAMRAVGSANGRNPLCIIIPCHRVIAADGTIGGYAGGLNIKRQLLALEGNTFNGID